MGRLPHWLAVVVCNRPTHPRPLPSREGRRSPGVISTPSQANSLPLSGARRPSMTSSSCTAARSALNRLPGVTLPWNGFDSPVSTVPGCSPTTIPLEFRRLSSIEIVFTNWFSAAFDARYPYQPPSLLSPILPTRAESTANTIRPAFGVTGRKCFATSAGPIALIAKLRAIHTGSSSRIAFSGPLSPSCSNPVATITNVGDPTRPAAAAMLASSSRSRCRSPLSDRANP